MGSGVTPVTYRLTRIIGMHPENQCCDGCPFCRTDTTNRDRKRCAVTEEVLYNPKQFGMFCPLVREEMEE